MNNKLTPKQEAFALNLFKGLSQREAYVRAGYSSNGKDNTTDIEAHKLANLPKVTQRVLTLQSEVRKVAIANVQERQEIATQVARAEMKAPVTGKEKVLAIAELNKMGGDYPPEKRDITFNGESLSDLLLKLRGYNPKQIGDGDASE